MARRIQGMKPVLLGAGAVLLLICAFIWWWENEGAGGGDEVRQPLLSGAVRSGNLSVDYEIPQVLADAERLSLNAVNVPVAVLIPDLIASDFELDPASLDKARELIPKLHQQGMRVLLEPYPWINNGSEVETKWNPQHKDVFFRNWNEKVLRRLVDELAQPLSVEALVAGSNLEHLEGESGQWVELLKGLRTRYDGLITYKTNWWYTAVRDESSRANFTRKRDNPLWAEVDFISVAAYFELAERSENTVGELISALGRTEVYGREQDVAGELEQLAGRWGKPYYFAELGFPARQYAAKEPWNPSPSSIFDGDEQARLFQAYRDVFRGRGHFLGYSVFAIGKQGSDKHYYPSQKSAEIIRSW